MKADLTDYPPCECKCIYLVQVTLDEVANSLHGESDPIWELIKREAKIGTANEPQLASTLYSSVLVHSTLEESLAVVIANALKTGEFPATQWMELFLEALNDDPTFGEAARDDIAAVMKRDPASPHATIVLLYCKGFRALQSYRLSHWLWKKDRKSLALYLQSMISSKFAVDIHPAAEIGHGIFVDHGTGIVIGETARVGNNVSILHNVTLGGTGKESGDRHPKVSDGVLIGAGATVLGNIAIGEGAHIAACSVCLKAVEPFSVVSGVPAKMLGKVSYAKGSFPSYEMDQRLSIDLRGPPTPLQNVVIKGDTSADPPEGNAKTGAEGDANSSDNLGVSI